MKCGQCRMFSKKKGGLKRFGQLGTTGICNGWELRTAWIVKIRHNPSENIPTPNLIHTFFFGYTGFVDFVQRPVF
jgi:hypothetical protein